jgi:predicted  nucleic acid-binding Zn-ribbon protein
MTIEEKIREEQTKTDGLAQQITKFKDLLRPNPADYDPAEKAELEHLEQQKEESDQRLAELKRQKPGNTQHIQATSEIKALETSSRTLCLEGY